MRLVAAALKMFADRLPNWTEVTSANPRPDIVTSVPPSVDPAEGLTVEMLKEVLTVPQPSCREIADNTRICRILMMLH